jgi:hypothetical protein
MPFDRIQPQVTNAFELRPQDSYEQREKLLLRSIDGLLRKSPQSHTQKKEACNQVEKY